MKYKYPKEIYVQSGYKEGESIDKRTQNTIEKGPDTELSFRKRLDKLEDGELAIYMLRKVVVKKTEVKLEDK